MNKYDLEVPTPRCYYLLFLLFNLRNLVKYYKRRINDVPLLILTDGVEDPHNMGAIIRTAGMCRATAVLIPKRHNALLMLL